MLLKLQPDQITNYWEDIKAAIIYAVPPLAQASQEGLNELLEGLLAGRMQAWTLYEVEEGAVKIYALIVTTVWVEIGTLGRNLLIYALYGYSFVKPELWKGALEILRKFARANDCQKIVAFSKVPRIWEIVSQLGGNTETKLVTLEV